MSASELPGPETAVQNPNRYPEAGGLQPWLRRLLAELAPKADSFGVRLVGDRSIRQLNQRFRSKDSPTDVLSFPGERTVEGRHLGDVVISVPTARRQASAQGHAPEVEVRTLLLHGVLHCLGYDHEADDGRMDKVERELRRRWVAADA